MNRQVSPLLHDYKPSAGSSEEKTRPFRWFVLGLGLPFVALALAMALPGSEDSVAPNPSPSAVNDPEDYEFAEPLGTEKKIEVGEAIAVDELPDLKEATAKPRPAAFHPPMELPPEYDIISIVIKRGDTFDRLFRKHKLNLGHLAAIANLPEAGRHLRILRPGDEFEIQHDDGQLVSLYSQIDLTSALQITRTESGFAAEIVERPVEIRKRLAYGLIETSLFESAASAGLPDRLIMNLAGIFAWDIDFVLDIRSNDNYYILFEEIYQDGKFVSDGEIIAAEFNNNGRTFQAIRYVDADGRSDYFTPDGDNVRKAFVRAPVDFTRISSSFNPRRRHPVLNTIRAHRGVDYAAPKGTPIKAAGDGKVIFRGRKGGYGNAVILQHGGNITTLYAHMSRFADSAKISRRVRQGQTIGYVGSTGLATAAHLHYEYRLNGVHRNPRTVELPQAEPIRKEYRQDFLSQSEPILNELLRFKRTQIAIASND